MEEHGSGGEMSLFVEFSALISWQPGSGICKHTDNGKPHLAQRDYSAIVYLNDADKNFDGGVFEFGDGERIHPKAGRLLAYSASQIHSVTPILSGERFTVAFWFTRDGSRDEDCAILAALSLSLKDRVNFTMKKEVPVPNSMYLYSDGMDIRICRLACLNIGLARQNSNGYWEPLIALSDDSTSTAVSSNCILRILLKKNDDTEEKGQGKKYELWSTKDILSTPFVAVCGLVRWSSAVTKASSTQQTCAHHLYQATAHTSVTHRRSCLWLRSITEKWSPNSHQAMICDSSVYEEAVSKEEEYMELEWAVMRDAQASWSKHGALFSVP